MFDYFVGRSRSREERDNVGDVTFWDLAGPGHTYSANWAQAGRAKWAAVEEGTKISCTSHEVITYRINMYTQPKYTKETQDIQRISLIVPWQGPSVPMWGHCCLTALQCEGSP